MKASEDDLRTMFRFLNEVSIVAQLAGNALERAMGEAMTLPQFAVLNHLTRLGGGKNPVHLARAMQVAKGAMTKTLGHLDRAGFIAILPDPTDGRAKRVNLTKAGQKAHAAAIAAIGPELHHLATRMAMKNVREALQSIEQVRRILDDRRSSGQP